MSLSYRQPGISTSPPRAQMDEVESIEAAAIPNGELPQGPVTQGGDRNLVLPFWRSYGVTC